MPVNSATPKTTIDRKPRKSSGRMSSKGFPNPLDVLVGSRIRQRRTLLGLSQEKLGEAIGLTFQQVQKYERGANRIGVSRLIDIAEALHLDAGELLADLPADVVAKSPARLMGTNPTAFVVEDNPLNKRRVMELAKSFVRIEDEVLANSLYHAVKAAGANGVRGSRDSGRAG